MGKNGTRLIKDNRPKPILTGDYSKNEQRKAQLSFSFLYFNQKKNFGLDSVGVKWFIGFLDRLKDMCSKTGFEDKKTRLDYRLHPINWQQKNIPLKRKDLNWLPREYRDNEEFEIYQFIITKATGRIIGFFNEESNVFYIVLLDPNHNMQPCQYNNYKIRESNVEWSLYEESLSKMDHLRNLISKCKYNKNCNVLEEIVLDNNIISCSIDDSFAEALNNVISKGDSFKDIIERGILELSN